MSTNPNLGSIEDTGSISEYDSEYDDEDWKGPSQNECPVKMKPAFKKYGVADFKFLKVLGKGR